MAQVHGVRRFQESLNFSMEQFSCRCCEKGCWNRGMKLSPILLFPTGEVLTEPPTQPSLRTPETVNKICATIREVGLADLAAGALAGVGSAAMTRWFQEDEEFAGRLEAAREEFRNK